MRMRRLSSVLRNGLARLARVRQAPRGQSLTEYVLVLAVISIATAGAVALMGTALFNLWSAVGSQLTSVVQSLPFP